MIKAEVTYSFTNKELFETRFLPYIFGCGMFYTKKNPKLIVSSKNSKFETSFVVETRNLTQFVSAITGMLRFSPDSILKKIKIIKCDKVISKKLPSEYENKPILGVILKPSIYFEKNIKGIVDYAISNNYDFVKDDDASEYSDDEFKKIKALMKNIKYLQKITSLDNNVGDWWMIVPWVYGWNLLEQSSKINITASHCATLPSQIEWQPFIILSRLAGASLVVGADKKFDSTFNVEEIIKASKERIAGVPETKVILGGGINPKRIEEILKSISKEDYRYIGFAECGTLRIKVSLI